MLGECAWVSASTELLKDSNTALLCSAALIDKSNRNGGSLDSLGWNCMANNSSRINGDKGMSGL
jgi:hypothetical protein